jgi:twitching motility protein PilT
VAQTLLPKVGGGRVAAHEILMGTSAVRNLIREDRVAQIYSTLQTGQSQGMQTLDQALQRLVQQGVIERETARSVAAEPASFD